VISYLYSGRPDLLMRDLVNVPSMPGVTEIVVHPGIPSENSGLDFGNWKLERYLASDERLRETEACLSARQWAGGIELTNFRSLTRRAAA
jgi:hypothetical protein